MKFDLLGLGHARGAALRRRPHRASTAAYDVDLATIPQEDDGLRHVVPGRLGRACSRSRAGPRWPRCPGSSRARFYDLVVEVALIRPGPIQGGSVHPYIRRRNGQEPVTYLHPLLENSAGQDPRRAAVPGAADADGDRRRRLHAGRGRPAAPGDGVQAQPRARWSGCASGSSTGMAERGITGEVADEIFDKMAAFANFGFPESHSVSFAYLVYASSWIKLHDPAAFCAALLNAQPMGFYSPHSLVQDARRHGVDGAHARPQRARRCARATLRARARRVARTASAVRLGLGSVRGVGDRPGRAIVAERARTARTRRGGPRAPARRRLDARPRSRRWPPPARSAASSDVDGRRSTGAGRCGRSGRWPSRGPTGWPAWSPAPTRRTLPGMTEREEAVADLWATGVSPDGHPDAVRARPPRRARACVTAAGLRRGRRPAPGAGRRRRHPSPAAGDRGGHDVPEPRGRDRADQRGLLEGCWARYRRVARGAPALLIRGRLEKAEGVINIVAEQLEPLPRRRPPARRDFR